MTKEVKDTSTRPSRPKPKIQWREWSQAPFDDAKTSKRLVLLDLSAEWCHWCHVMDETTYSNAEIIDTINRRFIPIRVDIDKRPDISERYNRGGFPTTAFLSEQGESIWGATYVPPEDMKNVLRAMLEAQKKGEVDEVLARERMQYLDLSRALEKNESVDREFVDAIFEDIFAAYDVEWGGFGIEPKFPHADAIDLLIERYAHTNDSELAGAVVSTLDHMTKGLHDDVEGGVFRYSVKRDWRVPHYEKMLDTNLGFLRNLARARQILGHERYGRTAESVGKYLLGTLRDPKTGGFFSSQDADEEYYKLDKTMRGARPHPKIIDEIFSGLNCRAVSILVEAGALLGRQEWVDASKMAWQMVIREFWSPTTGLIKHMSGDSLFLFDDQVEFFEALIAIAEIQSREDMESTLHLGEDLIKGVGNAFAHPDGGYGDVMRERGAIGKLAYPERSIAANSRWATTLALFGAATYKPERSHEAWATLKSFTPKRVQANGIFASDYVYAWDVLELGPKAVEIHGIAGEPTGNDLWNTAKKALDPGTVVLASRRVMLEIPAPRPFAVICKETGCSKEIYEPGELARQLRPLPPGQI